MDLLIGMAKSLLVITMIASFLELLIPDSTMRPFVRFAIGMFILLAVLNPLLRLIQPSGAIETAAWELPMGQQTVDTAELQRAREQGTVLKQEVFRAGKTAMGEKIEHQIKAVGHLVPGVSEIEPTIRWSPDGTAITSVVIRVRTEPQKKQEGFSVPAFGTDTDLAERSKIENRLSELVQNFFSIDQDQIKILFEEG